MSSESEKEEFPTGDMRDITSILQEWEIDAGTVTARRVTDSDGSEQIQLRIPMGLLQLSPDDRPDGARPDGFVTMLARLRDLVDQDHKTPTAEQWFDLDREIMQYYHRRIAMLSLAEAERRDELLREAAADYARVVRDADHNLEIMDFIKQHNTDAAYINMHEQYRTFVLSHRTLGAGLYWVCRNEPEEALDTIHVGLKRLEQAHKERGTTDVMRRDTTAGPAGPPRGTVAQGPCHHPHAA